MANLAVGHPNGIEPGASFKHYINVTSSLTGTDSTMNGLVLQYQNPEGIPLIITRCVLRVITPPPAGVVLNIGNVPQSTPAFSSGLLDDLAIPSNTPTNTLFDNWTAADRGDDAAAKAFLGSNHWITVTVGSTGDANGLVAELYLYCQRLVGGPYLTRQSDPNQFSRILPPAAGGGFGGGWDFGGNGTTGGSGTRSSGGSLSTTPTDPNLS